MLKTPLMMLKTLKMVLKPWRNPGWVGKALMTHFVVIHALMVSWYPRRRFGNLATPQLMS